MSCLINCQDTSALAISSMALVEPLFGSKTTAWSVSQTAPTGY